MSELHKLRVRVGPHEFEAEGTEAAVESLFKAWRELVDKSAVPAQMMVEKPIAPHPAGNGSGERSAVDESRMGDIFSTDAAKGLVSLRVHPTGDSRNADALLLLVYGFRLVGSNDEVPVTKLKEGLAVSGIRVDRVDRAIAPHVTAGYLLKAGMGKGGKYRLTNTGLTKVAALQQELLGKMA